MHFELWSVLKDVISQLSTQFAKKEFFEHGSFLICRPDGFQLLDYPLVSCTGGRFSQTMKSQCPFLFSTFHKQCGEHILKRYKFWNTLKTVHGTSKDINRHNSNILPSDHSHL